MFTARCYKEFKIQIESKIHPHSDKFVGCFKISIFCKISYGEISVYGNSLQELYLCWSFQTNLEKNVSNASQAR